MALDKSLFDFHNRTKLAFVNALRFAFKNPPTPDIYKYSDIQNSSQIAIYRDFPRREPKWPALLVAADAGDISVQHFAQEELEEIYDDDNILIGYQAGGRFVIPIKIRILAQSTTDRERLTDLVHLFVRFLFRNRFADERIAYTKIRTTGESNFKLADETIIYENAIIVEVYGEIDQTFDVSTIELIERIDLFIDDTQQVVHARVGENP